MRNEDSMLTNLDGPHANVWIECACGHTFWWNTYEYGPEPSCSECDREYTIMVTLCEKLND